jgi:MoxR-like ATPase
MEERQITIDGKTYALPAPFFVIATQNPSHHAGTYPLPESQLDRFLMRIELGYPDHHAERQLLAGKSRQGLLEDLPVLMPVAELFVVQQKVREVYASPALLDYLQAIIDYSRQSGLYQCGLSPRAGLALLTAAKAWALMEHRDAVIPEDVQAVLAAVAGHRIRSGTGDSEAIVAPILNDVAVI